MLSKFFELQVEQGRILWLGVTLAHFSSICNMTFMVVVFAQLELQLDDRSLAFIEFSLIRIEDKDDKSTLRKSCWCLCFIE
ncbi:hypothetical protein SCA6_016668 [Theobroma cacao]